MEKRYNLYNLLSDFTHYLTEKAGLRAVSAKNYKSDIAFFLRWLLQKRSAQGVTAPSPDMITEDLLADFREYMRQATQPQLANRKLSSLRSFLRYLESLEISVPKHRITNIERSERTNVPQETVLPIKPPVEATPPSPTPQEATRTSRLRAKIHPKSGSVTKAQVGAALGLISLFLFFMYGLYAILVKQLPKSAAFPQTLTRGTRTLSFQGRLTDSLGNPITASTNVVFKLYTASSGGSQLYTSGTCSVTPDQDGIFNSIIGQDCGSEIGSAVFTENANVYLGITVGADSEMTPRQQIANVGYALNAETLQGFPAGTEVSTIPYINKDGNVLIGASAPGVRNTYASATFVVSSANAVTLQSAGSGDVTLTATESGTIKFLTGGTQAGVVTNGQLWGFGTTGPDAKVDSLATSGEQLRLTYTDGSAYTGFTTSSGGDLTIDPSGDDLTIDGDAILADTFTVQVGGKTGTAYNAFANSGQSPSQGAIAADNDVYIGGDLEVTGNLYAGSLTASNLPWSGLTAPTADLTVSMAAYNSTFSWDPGADTTETAFTINFDGEDSAADQDQVLLALNQSSNGTDVTEAADALLTLTNSDANDPVENAIRFDAGAAGTDFTYGINFDAASIGTAELVLQNGETIANTVDGTIALTGDASISGTTGLTFTSTGGVNLAGGTLVDSSDGVDIADNLEVSGDTTLTGDIAVNGDDITSDGTLTIDAATDLVLDADGADVFLKDNAVTFATLTNSSTDLTLDIAGGQLVLADTDVFNIGGVTGLAYNAISDSGTTSHALASDNDLYVEGDVEVDGTLYVDGTLSASTLSCTDCLDFTSFADSLTLDATTDINLGANNLTVDLDSTGIFDIRDGATTFVSFDDDSTIDITFPAAGTLGIDATTTANTTTGGVIDLNVNAGDVASLGLNIDYLQANGATAGRDAIAQAINLTANDADGDVFGSVITANATANAAAGSYEALLKLINAENSVGAVTDGILISSTSGTDTDITDAIDVSDSNIVNAINVGANTVLGTTGNIDLTNFDVVGSSGNITTAGDIAVNGDDITGDSNLTINAASYTRVGDTATPGSATGDDDLFVESDIELDGTLYADGIITQAGGDGSSFAGAITFNDDVDLVLAGTENMNIASDLAGSVNVVNIVGTPSGSAGTAYGLYVDQANSANTNGLDASIVIDNSDTNLAIADGILFVDAGGAFTDFIDTPSSVFKVDGSGNITGVGETLTGDLAVNGGDITTTGDLTINPGGGDVNLGASDNLNLTASSNLTFAGTTTLAETTAANDSGAYFVGAFDEFDNSNSTTVQGVLNDLDAGLTTALAGATVWTDSGTTAYLTATTDEVVIGGSSPLSSSKLSIDGDADQIQLTIQGNATQTSSLAVFEDSAGTDLLTVSGAGVLSVPYLIDISNTAYGIDPAGTGNFGGYSLKVTGGALLAVDSGNVGIGNSTPVGKLDVNGKVTGKALAIFNETGDQNILTASASGTTVMTLDRSGNLSLEGAINDISGNLVLNDTVDIGSASTGINVTTAGALSDIDGNLVLADTLDLGSASTGLNITTAGLITDIDGNVVIGDTVDLGSASTGVNVTTAGVLSDINAGTLEINDDLQIDGNDILDSGAATRITLGATTTLTNTTLTLSGTSTLTASSLTALNCSDCIDFDDMEDTLDLDAALTLNQSTNTWTQNFTGTTTDGLTYNGNSLSSGNLIKLSSTSTAFSSGAFISGDWSPGSLTTNSGDLFVLNTGSNGNLTGNYINLKKGGSTLFKVVGGTGNVSTEGDLAINGGDITSSAALNIDVNTNITTPDTLTVGSSTAGVGQLTVTGAQTGKALAIFNETGNQNILVASSSGTSAFVITHNGDISKGESHGVNGLNDSGSLVPNGSFEVNSDTTNTKLPDGWTTRVGTVTVSTDSKHGAYALATTSLNDEAYSTCFPVSGDGTARTYTASIWAKGSAATSTYRAGLYSYATLADCTAHTSIVTTLGNVNTSTSTSYAAGNGTGSPAFLGATSKWARAYIVNLDNENDDVTLDGFRLTPTLLTTGLDLAETYPVAINDNIKMGEIVDFGTAEKQDGADVKNIKRSSKAYDNLAFGVIATNPGIVLDDDKSYEKVKVALKGRVPVLVSTENGPIHIGDPIAASSKPGVGMKATRSGRIIGYAMTEWTDPNPDTVDQVTVFVNPENIEASLENQGRALDNAAIDLKLGTESATMTTNPILKINGELITAIRAFSKVITASIQTGLLEAQNVIAETLRAKNINANYVVAERIDTTNISATTVKTDSLDAKNITAENIDSQNIRELQDRLLKVAGVQDETATTSSALAENYTNLSNDINAVQSQIEALKNQPLPDPQYYQSTTSGPLANLTVTGAANIYDLYAAHTATIDSVFIEDSTISTLAETLHLNALENIDLLDGAVVIARDGSLTAQGQVIAKGGVRTNTIQPLTDGQDVAVKLSSQSSTNPLTGETSQSEFVVTDDTNQKVAGINAKGEANVNGLSINGQSNFNTIVSAAENNRTNGIFAPSVDTHAAAAGSSILPAGSTELLIYNENVTDKTLMYITPTSYTYNKSLYVASKEICAPTTQTPCKKYVKIALDQPLAQDVTFNWWIIN